MTLIKFQVICYIMADAKTKKNSRSFAQNIFHVKIAHLNFIQNQLIMTWNALNCEFWFQISKPNVIITIRQFFRDLNNHVGIWQKIARRKTYAVKPSISFKRTNYNSKSNVTFFQRKKTKNRDLFKIIKNFMNLFNNTDHIQYLFAYQEQDQNRFKHKSRREKSNSDRVFDTKIIADSFFKIPLKITFENKSDLKKSNKNFRSKGHVYMIENDEKKIDYYEFNDKNDDVDSNANHENKNYTLDVFDQKNFFIDMIITDVFKEKSSIFQCKKCYTRFIFNKKFHRHVWNKCQRTKKIRIAFYHINFSKKISIQKSQKEIFYQASSY